MLSTVHTHAHCPPSTAISRGMGLLALACSRGAAPTAARARGGSVPMAATVGLAGVIC